MRLGFSTSPARSTGCPDAMSAARRPTCWRGYTGVKMRTSGELATRSVSSTITTASAPCGIGAPVAISMHSPAPTVLVGELSGVDLLDRSQGLRLVFTRAESVFCAHGVAVHGRPIERRNVHRGRGRRDQDAAVGVAQRDPFGARDRLRGIEDQRQRLVERNRLANRPHRLAHHPIIRAMAPLRVLL